MQGQSQPRYEGNRGGYNPNRQQPQGGGGNMPRQAHSHQNQQPQQQQQPPLQGGQQNVGVSMRPHVPGPMPTGQQQQGSYIAHPVQVFMSMQPQQMMRYPIQPYASYGPPPPQLNPHFQQQQLFAQAHMVAYPGGIAAGGGGNYYPVPTPAQNVPQHQPQQQYFTQPTSQAIPTHYVRNVPPVPGAVPQQVPSQSQQAHGPHQMVHQAAQPNAAIAPPVGPQLVAPGPHSQTSEPREPPPPRRRRVLPIINPKTGEKVINSTDEDRAPSASPQPTVEPVPLPEEPILPVSHEPFEEIGPVSSGQGHSYTLAPSPLIDETPPIEVEKQKKAKSEFFQRITAVNDDDNSGRSSSASEVINVTSSLPPLVPASSSPTPAVGVRMSPTLEPPVAVSAPSVFHSPVPSPSVVEPDRSTTTPPVEELPSQLSPPSSVAVDHIPVETIPVTTNENQVTGTVTEELISTPPRPDGGRGDESLDISTTSVSPEPIEKYIEVTPEKAPVPLSTESGEPSSIGNSTRESTASPPFALKGDSSVATPDQVHSEDDEELSKVTTALDEISLTSVEPVRVEPSFTNGGNGLDDASGEEDMEEGEIPEPEECDADDESNEPVRKRIVYDRDTLIHFKSGAGKDVQGIDSIPPELIRDGKPQLNNFGPPPRPGSGGFHPYGRTPSMGKGMGGNRYGRDMPMGGQWGGIMQVPPQPPGGRYGPPPPVTLVLDKPKLHKAEDAWKPGAPKLNKDMDEAEKEKIIVEELKKRARGILNKLTPENFEKLVQKFMELKFEDKTKDMKDASPQEIEAHDAITAGRVGAVISVVFEKAIDEPGFAASYARMVHYVTQGSQVTSKIFRKKLLDHCQREFQQGSSEEENLNLLRQKLEEAEDDKKELIKLEIEEKKFTARRRSLGNVRFIGELFKLGMLTPKIMVECVDMLLGNQDDESYECLCKLLTTIGQKLEENIITIFKSGNRNTKSRWMPDEKFMPKTFDKLKALSNDLNLSSRIRFALLDVWELRDSGWKPRRDANAPKTIDEVRKAAIREEQEEKKQLMNLPPPDRGPPSRGPLSQPKKGSEWNTVSSNKSSRFIHLKKQTDSGGELHKFAPPSYGRPSGLPPQGGGSGLGFQQPPRFSRLQECSEGPAPTPTRDEIVRELPGRTPASSHSSRESSRPQTPTHSLPSSRPSSQSRQPASEPAKEIDVAELVKQIFQEAMSTKKLDYEWIQQRFPGERVAVFVDELSRQVCDMSKEDQQKTAGGIIKSLIKKELISKAQVIDTLKDGVVMELPDIEVDVPKATSYFAMFLSELFSDEGDLGWLIPLGELLQAEYPDSWTNIVTNTLHTLKLRRSEEFVQGLYKRTSEQKRLPIEDSWVCGETLESVTEKMMKVLQSSAEDDDMISILKENSWDLREELTLKGLMEAICNVSWIPATGKLDSTKLQRFLGQVKLPSPTLCQLMWQQAKDFIKRNNVDTEQENILWELLQKHEKGK